ncbi:hypothetical protein UA08_04500 [Talaromyces atroroseus]|uniref:Xylanolytic transcriptional activator regulatory domain-containing protein n=1 Tax=Talaromyces atroroseus TaxID=1441469 RepID=A0A225AXQ1_TALAT|nr:hypothetical protein UA08_04500 [Talaromyces atroroseus]OKL59756.1 hypothetical protein UA08_04500 [Talaromyces atroroseus]
MPKSSRASQELLRAKRKSKRCASLTALIRRLNPDVDIEDALRTTNIPSGSVQLRDFHRNIGIPASIDEFEWSEASITSPAGARKATLDGMASLPTANTEAGFLVDTYFMCYNTSYPILHEHTFRQKYQDRHQIQSRSSWHTIFYIVFAIGNWIRGGTSESKQCVYYSAARSCMSMQMLESGTLLTVQVFLLMGNYLQKQDRPNTGYNFIGIAYRMALGLGLHREVPAGTKRDSLIHERRRVIWWIVYCFDSGFSLTTVMHAEFDITLVNGSSNNVLCYHCTSTTSFHWEFVYRSVISAPKGVSLDLKASRSLDHQLKTWKLSLPLYFTARDIPDWFRGPRAVIIWKELNLRMMLWWGSYRLCNLASDAEDAQSMCHYIAIETIQDITTFCLDYPDNIHAGLSWYATYFLFQATVVLSIHYLKPHYMSGSNFEAVNKELWILSTSRARNCLANLSRGNEAATRCLAVLDRIRDQSQQSHESTSTPSVAMPAANFNLDNLHTQHDLENDDMHPTSFEIDPSLQILFRDTSWNGDLFEGLEGFPIIAEPEVFDYMPSNGLLADTPHE